jgi:type IV pilus assembly protein PilN
MRLDINLASRPYEDERQFWLRWGGALAGLAIVTLMLLYFAISGFISARKDHSLIQQAQQQIGTRDQEKAKAEALLGLPQNRSTRDRSQFLNDAFQRKAFSWTLVFEDLERVMPPRLHVVSIQPDMSPDDLLEIKLVVAGESRERAEELVRKMEGSQRFQQTHINLERTQTNSQTPGDAVQFDISALYIPETNSSSKGAR